jgi:hypothetical protein
VRRAVLKMTAKAKGVHNVESDVVDLEWPPVVRTVSLYAAAAAGRMDEVEAWLGGHNLTQAKALADAGKPVLEWDREWFGRSPLHAAAMEVPHGIGHPIS